MIELTDLQIISMFSIAIGLLGVNVFIIQSKKLKKKSKLTFTLFCTFAAYSICVLIDMHVYSTLPDISDDIVSYLNQTNV